MAKKKKKARKTAPRKTAHRKTTKRAVSKKSAPRKERRDRSVPETLRLRSAAPSFTVNDLQKSLAFYTEVLGFYPKQRWERDGKLAGVELVAGAASFYLGQDDWKKGRDRVKGEGVRIYCETVQNIDALAARIKAKGGMLTEEPKDQPWGTRDFSLADPDGYKITFSTEMK